ncbi:MAG: hypothetical protein ABH896_00920 [Candidatus Jacksonbacteria bacterium]
MYLSQNLINRIRETREKLIIVNNNGEPQVVLMSYEIYQSYCDNQKNNRVQNNNLTSDELLDRINQNIAQWKEQQNNPTDLEKDYFVKEEIENYNDIVDNIDAKDMDEDRFDEDRFYLETINSDL